MALAPLDRRQRHVDALRAQLGACALCFWRADSGLTAQAVLAAPQHWIEGSFLLPRPLHDWQLLRDPERIAGHLPLALRARGGPVPAALLLGCVAVDDGQTLGAFVAWDAVDRVPADLSARRDLLELLLDVLAGAGGPGASRDVAAPQLRALAQSLPQAVALVAPDAARGYLNARAAHLLGLPAGEVAAAELAQALQSLLDRAGNSGALRERAQRLLEAPPGEQGLTELLEFAEASPRALRVTLAPMQGADGPLWAWLLEDVSAEFGLQRQLEAEEQKFRDFFEHLDEAIALYSLDGVIVQCNQRFRDLFGARTDSWHDQARAQQAGGPGWSKVREDCLRQQTLGPYEGCLGEAGAQRWLEASAMLRRDAAGRAVGIWEVVRDITARKATEMQLMLDAEAFTRHSDGVLLTDADQRIVTANDTFIQASGYAREELRGRRPSLLQSGRHGAAFYRDMQARLREQGWWQGGIWNRARDGKLFFRWLSIEAVRGPGGEVTHYTGVYRDVQRVRKAQSTVEYLATHDELTRLPNRAWFVDQLQTALSRPREGQRRLGVLLLQLREWHSLLSVAGSRSARNVLKLAARRLLARCPPDYVVARSGETQFAVLGTAGTAQQLQRLGEDLLAALARAIEVDGVQLMLGAAAGISIHPDDAEHAEDLLLQAEAAVQRACQPGMAAVQRFRPDMVQALREQFELEQGLRQALAHQRLYLLYQPQVRCGDRALHGCEALVRWRREDGSVISPALFVPAAERCGLIVELTHWVLREGCRQLRAWDEQGLNPGLLGVNLSANHFQFDDMVPRLLDIVREVGVDPRRICLEVTEGAMADPERCHAKVEELKRAGFSVSVDDFGTGFSSLSYLKRFAFDELKVDRSFVSGIETDEDDRAIVSAIVSLAHSLGLRVVAEGVENQAQVDFLQARGCDLMQGYWFARPLPGEQLAACMAAERRAQGAPSP